MRLYLLIASTFAVPAVSLGAEGGFTSCHTIGSMEGSGEGSSCAVFARRRKALDAAVDQARQAVKDRMDLIDWLWEPYCRDFCESIDLEYRRYGTCGTASVSAIKSVGNRCDAPSIGRRRHASVDAEVETGCLCWGFENY